MVLAEGSGGRNRPEHQSRPYIVLVSFDGFRHDYLNRGITPNFELLSNSGARADALIPVFPTKTYPNHYSIATGMYAGRHGIVANEFYDSGFDATYRIGDRSAVEDGRWYDGEPIWVTAETQGMVTAAMFFIGTEAPVHGVQPTFWTRYVHTLPNEQRIETVLNWLRMPTEQRPHLITLYFSVLDDAGHRYGPDAPETLAAIREADALLGRLMIGIDSLPIGSDVHLVIVSDHGMVRTDRGVRVIDSYATFAAGDVVIVAGTLAQIHVRDPARRARIANELSRMPDTKTFLREDLPSDWHVRDNPRIGDVVVVADEGVQLARRDHRPNQNQATHGYAPMPSMHGIFIASGRRIIPRTRIPAFENVHIYALVAEILQLRPSPSIDGRLDVLRPILRPLQGRPERQSLEATVADGAPPEMAWPHRWQGAKCWRRTLREHDAESHCGLDGRDTGKLMTPCVFERPTARARFDRRLVSSSTECRDCFCPLDVYSAQRPY